jgi:hypothetical protein
MKESEVKKVATRITNLSQLDLDDWIFIVEDGIVYKAYAEVIKNNEEKIKARTIGFYNKKGNFVRKNAIFNINVYSNYYSIYRENNYKFSDFYSTDAKKDLIDLALQTDDEKWFEELAN